MTALPEVLERVLGLSKAEECIAIGVEWSEANVRWANNASTTNGESRGSLLYVVSAIGGRVGTVGRSFFPPDRLEDVVRASEAACEGKPTAEDAMPVLEGDGAPPDWSDEVPRTGIGVLSSFIPALASALERARADGLRLFGFAEHRTETVFVATSRGLRRRHTQDQGLVEVTAKTPDLSRSAWTGRGTTTFRDVDVGALYERLARRLAWAQRGVELPPGRYQVLLEPPAAADMCLHAYAAASAREADEGRSVYAKPGGGNRVGEQLYPETVTMYSDPAEPGLEVHPFLVTTASSSYASVFDNGLPLARTEWVSGGVLRNLITTRHWAHRQGTAVTPFVPNLVVDAPGGSTIEDMVASTDRALLVTCFWYIRTVDPRTLLLTGLTRDGVYLVERGEVRGAVNNFRFNESPVDMLARTSEIGRSEPTLGRELGRAFPRTRVPPLRVEGFNMSSVSQAT